MRLVRFISRSGTFWGEFDPDGIIPLIGDPFGDFRRDTLIHPHGEVRLLAPVKPSKIICVGLNYADHVSESDTADQAPKAPLLFFKPPSSIVGPGQVIRLPESSNQVEFEGELALVIGRRATAVAPVEAEEYIYGITCANDISARDFQRSDNQWARAKGFDTFCPIGPWVCVGEPYTNLEIETYQNTALKQRANTDEMLIKPHELVSYISGIMTLEPGDVILTGTPAGVGPLADGDQVEVRIQGIGSLVNDVRNAGAD